MPEKIVTPTLPAVSSEEERVIRPGAPGVSDLPKTFLDFAGYSLTAWTIGGMFFVIGCFLLILAVGSPSTETAEQKSNAAVLLSECLKPDAKPELCPPARIDLARSIISDPALSSYRDFWKNMFERVVGAILFPLVTALLGYLFAQGRNGTGSPASPPSPPNRPPEANPETGPVNPITNNRISSDKTALVKGVTEKDKLQTENPDDKLKGKPTDQKSAIDGTPLGKLLSGTAWAKPEKNGEPQSPGGKST